MTAAPPRPGDTGAYRRRPRRGGAWLWWLLALLVVLIVVGIVLAIVLPGSGKKSAPPVGASSAIAASAASPGTPSQGAGTAGPASSAAGTGAGAASATAPLVGGGGLPIAAATGTEASTGTLGTVLFASNSATIDAVGDQVIAHAADALKADHATAATVVGYTDTVAGTPTNDPLSAERAAAVAARLRTLLPGVTVTTRAVGEADAVATNTTADGRAQNRRAVISLAS